MNTSHSASTLPTTTLKSPEQASVPPKPKFSSCTHLHTMVSSSDSNTPTLPTKDRHFTILPSKAHSPTVPHPPFPPSHQTRTFPIPDPLYSTLLSNSIPPHARLPNMTSEVLLRAQKPFSDVDLFGHFSICMPHLALALRATQFRILGTAAEA